MFAKLITSYPSDFVAGIAAKGASTQHKGSVTSIMAHFVQIYDYENDLIKLFY